jgi:endonuclease/exonuclease/phosphatase family metal-dependent hydrolase
MRVVSWNLWWRFGEEWRERQVRIIEVLEELRADVVGLQEVWAGRDTSQAEILARPLGMQAVFAAPSLPPPPTPAESPDHLGVDVGVAVLSRWPIVECVSIGCRRRTGRSRLRFWRRSVTRQVLCMW